MKKNSLFIAIIALAILAIYFIGQTVVLKKELKATEQCLVETEQCLVENEQKLYETGEKLNETICDLKVIKCELHNTKVFLNCLEESYLDIKDRLDKKDLENIEKPRILVTDLVIMEYTMAEVSKILMRYDIPNSDSVTNEIVDILFDVSTYLCYKDSVGK